jgi:hydrogenase-4 component E
VALAGLVATVAVHGGQGVHGVEAELLAVAVLVLAVKGAAIPWALTRTAGLTGARREEAPLMGVTAGLIAAALLTMLAYVVSQAVVAVMPGPAPRAVPVGVALVLIGFLVLMTRRHALSQLVGFVVLDNGIAGVAFLTAGGVPLVVELGVSLDVLLVVLILRVLTARLQLTFGVTDLDDLMELHD